MFLKKQMVKTIRNSGSAGGLQAVESSQHQIRSTQNHPCTTGQCSVVIRRMSDSLIKHFLTTTECLLPVSLGWNSDGGKINIAKDDVPCLQSLPSVNTTTAPIVLNPELAVWHSRGCSAMWQLLKEVVLISLPIFNWKSLMFA